jgi:NADPH:quinone reductase-like Zn-dependent oxidoreductase
MKNQTVVISKVGFDSVMELVDESLPMPTDNQVRIKVLSSGVAFADILMRRGLYPNAPNPPFVPGYDIVGLVDSIGSSVDSFKIGQRVAALTITGGYSNYICLDKDRLTLVPESVDTYKASAVILNYLTAYQMLFRTAKVQPKDRILIHGASGGVGSAMLDLAKNSNLKIYGTASFKHQGKVSTVAEFIDYKNEDFVKKIRTKEAEGMDFVFDGVGGYNWRRSYQVLKETGFFIGYGMTYLVNNMDLKEKEFMQKEWQMITSTHTTSTGHRAEVFSMTKNAQENPAMIREDLDHIFTLLKESQIDPTIAQTVGLENARAAHDLIEQGVYGKVLLRCNE